MPRAMGHVKVRKPARPVKIKYTGKRKEKLNLGKGLKVYWVEYKDGRRIAIWQKKRNRGKGLVRVAKYLRGV